VRASPPISAPNRRAHLSGLRRPHGDARQNKRRSKRRAPTSPSATNCASPTSASKSGAGSNAQLRPLAPSPQRWPAARSLMPRHSRCDRLAHTRTARRLALPAGRPLRRQAIGASPARARWTALACWSPPDNCAIWADARWAAPSAITRTGPISRSDPYPLPA